MTWPRRKRNAQDDAALTVAGCSTYLQRQRGRENGFYDPNEPLPREGACESPSQRRDREFARAWRLRIGPESWNELHQAYAEEIEQALKVENKITDKRKATNAEA